MKHGVTEAFRLGDRLVEPMLNRISTNDAVSKLDPKNMQVLLLLAERYGQVVSQREIEDVVWANVMVTPNSVYQSVTQLRRALGDAAKNPLHLQTIPRRGYRLLTEPKPIAVIAAGAAVIPVTSDAINTEANGTAVGAVINESPTPLSENKLPAAEQQRSTWLLQNHLRTVGRPTFYLTLTVATLVMISYGLLSLWTPAPLRQIASAQSATLLQNGAEMDPSLAIATDPKLFGDLDQTTEKMRGDFVLLPAAKAAALETLGHSYRRQGFDARAAAVLEEAVRVRRTSGMVDGPSIGATFSELALAYRGLGQQLQSKQAIQQALDIYSKHPIEVSTEYAKLVANLGYIELISGNYVEGERLTTTAFNVVAGLNLQGMSRTLVAEILCQFASVHLWKQDSTKAERAIRESIKIYTEILPAWHPERLTADSMLGEVLRHEGRNDEAEALLERVLSVKQLLYGSSGFSIAQALASLAQIRFAQQRSADAEQLMRDAIAAVGTTETAINMGRGYLLGNLQTKLAKMLLSRGGYAEAEILLHQALDTLITNLQPNSPYVAAAEHFLGEAQLALHKFAEAEVTLRNAAKHWEAAGAPQWRSARSRSTLGEVLYRLGRVSEARALLTESNRVLAAHPAVDSATKSKARARVKSLRA